MRTYSPSTSHHSEADERRTKDPVNTSLAELYRSSASLPCERVTLGSYLTPLMTGVHMAKAFSVASWNVEHFGNPKSTDSQRVNRVVDFLQAQSPDVFALYEVEGKEVFQSVTAKMTGFTFHITEGPQTQEILVGIRNGFTGFFTQKVEFKSGVSLLRPGALLTVTVAGKHYSILFLHAKSGNDPRGLGLRDDMLVRACDFRKVLDKAPAATGKANYMFLGDLNTMGMQYKYVREEDIEAQNELLKLERQAKSRKMRMLSKSHPTTWFNGSNSTIPASSLDHVVASKHLSFKKFHGADVDVRGWPNEQGNAAKDAWIGKYSDHALLYFEVQRV